MALPVQPVLLELMAPQDPKAKPATPGQSVKQDPSA
jgi:hypothetical protein